MRLNNMSEKSETTERDVQGDMNLCKTSGAIGPSLLCHKEYGEIYVGRMESSKELQ
jgi:hypothetical protein